MVLCRVPTGPPPVYPTTSSQKPTRTHIVLPRSPFDLKRVPFGQTHERSGRAQKQTRHSVVWNRNGHGAIELPGYAARLMENPPQQKVLSHRQKGRKF